MLETHVCILGANVCMQKKCVENSTRIVNLQRCSVNSCFAFFFDSYLRKVKLGGTQNWALFTQFRFVFANESPWLLMVPHRFLFRAGFGLPTTKSLLKDICRAEDRVCYIDTT
jgi:hypothetical protein